MKGRWEFLASSEDLRTMEHAEKRFLNSMEDGYTKDESYETKIVRRNGLWQFHARRTDA